MPLPRAGSRCSIATICSLCIQHVSGSLGRALQHTLLDSWPGQSWPYLESRDLDWATANPEEYLTHHARTRLQTAAGSTPVAEGLDTRRPWPKRGSNELSRLPRGKIGRPVRGTSGKTPNTDVRKSWRRAGGWRG